MIALLYIYTRFSLFNTYLIVVYSEPQTVIKYFNFNM